MICLFGGTFDPVHNGHLHAATTAADAIGAETVRMVLSAAPPHKTQPYASVEQRWEMLQRACATEARLVADDIEIGLGGRGYTFDTLSAIRGECGDEAMFWVIGADAFCEMASWYRWSELLSLTHFVLLERGPLLLDDDMQAVFDRHWVEEVPESPAGGIVAVEAAMLEVSATVVRRRVAAGQPVEDLLPGGVCTYIRDHGLYLQIDDQREGG